MFCRLQPTLKKTEIWYRCACIGCRYPMILFTLVGKANEGTGNGSSIYACWSKVLHLFYESRIERGSNASISLHACRYHSLGQKRAIPFNFAISVLIIVSVLRAVIETERPSREAYPYVFVISERILFALFVVEHESPRCL